ncbi:ATP-binding cassette domain-containing protein [Streptomyces exfoliatus]|uniref:ATP-binding cassette domain-containing protein n=1 Tax=Streptomyces exfoliatus TaxID=1905 RepID=UPI003C303C8F
MPSIPAPRVPLRPSSPDKPPVLTVTGLAAAFTHRGRKVSALHGIDFTLPSGGSLGLVGASGSGKTTLMRAVVGLHPATGGTVTLDGTPLPASATRRTREHRRAIQLIPQNPLGTLNPSRTVGSAIRRPVTLHNRTPRAERDERVLELLDQVGLPADFASRYPLRTLRRPAATRLHRPGSRGRTRHPRVRPGDLRPRHRHRRSRHGPPRSTPG